jgi:hypothetical protein
MTTAADSERAGIPRIVLLTVALSKLFYAGIILLNLLWFPSAFRFDGFLGNFHWPTNAAVSWKLMLNTWDTNYYLFLSDSGYAPGQMANAMYPLWPLVIRAGKYVFFDSLASAIILSNLLSCAAFIVFYRFAAERYGSDVAYKSLLLMIFFPGSLFYFFGYSESLFLFLTVLCFSLMEKRRYTAAALTAFLCPQVKAIGIFIVIPLFMYLRKDCRLGRIPARYMSLLMGPLLGYGSVFFLMYQFTGNALEGFEAQNRFLAHASLAKVFMPLRFAGVFLSFGTTHDFLHSPLDRLWFILVLYGLYRLWRMDRMLCLYAVPITLFPAMSMSMMSFTRYAAVIFPIFIGYGEYFKLEARQKLYRFTLVLMAAIHAALVFNHINNYWAG